MMSTLDEYLTSKPASRQLLDALTELLTHIGPVQVRVSRSQVAFRRRIAFAWAWLPGQYLQGRGAPLALSIALRRRDPSSRWKQVVEPVPGRLMHHLELVQVSDLDDQVRAWLQEAWDLAQ